MTVRRLATCALGWASCWCAAGAVLGDTPSLPEEPAVEQELLQLAGGEGFRIRRTSHFLICYNTDDEVLTEFVSRVESTYAAVQRFMDVHEFPMTALHERLQILFFETPREFQAYAQRLGTDARGAAGFYHPASNRAAFYNALNADRLTDVNRRIAAMRDALAEQDGARRGSAAKEMHRLRIMRDRTIETINLLVVQHEVAHQVLFNLGLHVRGADNPPWVVEGLATLFESPPSAHGAGMGVVNQYRLTSFREALASDGETKHARAADFADACRAGRLVPLRRLIGDKSLLDTTDPHVESRYAEAWSLMHYLQRHHREDLGVYLTVLARRPSDRGYTAEQELMQFEYVFGPIDEKFEQRWLDYILKQRVRAL